MSTQDIIQYFMLAAVVTVLILAALTLNNVSKIKNETVPSLQNETAIVDVTVVLAAAIGTYAEGSFVQPANSRITAISAIPLAAISATANTGTVNALVGTSAQGAQLVAANAQIAAGGAAANPNFPVALTLVSATSPQYTSAARTVYFSVKNLLGPVDAGGVVRFVVTFTKF